MQNHIYKDLIHLIRDYISSPKKQFQETMKELKFCTHKIDYCVYKNTSRYYLTSLMCRIMILWYRPRDTSEPFKPLYKLLANEKKDKNIIEWIHWIAEEDDLLSYLEDYEIIRKGHYNNTHMGSNHKDNWMLDELHWMLD